MSNFAQHLLARGRDADPALLQGEQVMAYAELRRQSAAAAALLLASGCRPGERVGLFAENSPFFVVAYLGVLRAGLCAVPFQTEIDEAAFRRIAASTGLRRLWVSPRQSARVKPWVESLGLEPLGEDALSAARAPTDAGFAAVDESRDLAALMYTSGSTGEPKGVKVTHRNLATNTADIVDYLGLTPADRAMAVLPFYYCYGASVLHTHLAVGASLVLARTFMFPEKVLDELEARGCSGLAGVPSTYQILLRKTRFKERRFPALRWLQQAGGRLPEAFIRELRAAHPELRFYTMYGQTEATARMSYLPPERLDDKLGSIGKGLRSTRLEVLREDGRPVTPGSDEVGEIVASGDNVTAGYWQDEEETRRYFRGGRLYTGDLARVDADGFIFVVERARDFIKSAGNRVSPKEIEEVIAELPSVLEVAVVGVPDELWGEAIRAVVVGSAPGRPTADEVLAHCRKRLPNHKVPQYVVLADGLPKTSTGKVDKLRLRGAQA